MLTRHAITRRADLDGVAAAVVERDYVLAHVVAQLAHAQPSDGGRLVFKGGTALRFVHVGAYRYSADLDFSLVDGGRQEALAAIAEVLQLAQDHAGFPRLELHDEPTPAIAYVGPLAAERPRHIKLDLSTDEHVESVEQAVMRDVWPDLPEPVRFTVYSLDEITAEKLRCVLQRVQCRDLSTSTG